MKLRELMTTSVVTITPEESVALAARLLKRHNLGALPVCSYDGKLLGIVTDRDIVTRCIAADQDPHRVPVQDIMTREVETLSPEAEPKEVAACMASAQVRRLPVVEDGMVVGIVALGDLAVSRRCDTEAGEALSEISQNVRKKRH